MEQKSLIRGLRINVLKKITQLLNWVAIAFLVIVMLQMFFPGWEEVDPEEPYVFGGADGPTAIFVTTRVDPVLIIVPVAMVILLLMNLLVIRKQEK